MKTQTNTGYIVFLSVVAAIGGILFGYDTAVISGTIAGVATQFGLDAMQQGWFVGCALVGSIAGVGIGVVSIVSPMYISEVAVARWRGSLVSLYQLAITVGFLAAYLVNFGILRSAETAHYASETMQRIWITERWRGMFGAETLPAALFFLVLFFIPESPRWLLLRGSDERARTVLSRIYPARHDAEQEIAAVRATFRKSDEPQWRALLEPGIRRAVAIGAFIAILGQFMGVNAVLYYGPTIFENAGLSSGDSLFSQVLVGTVNMLTTVLALAIIDRVGRKQLVYWGVSGMILSLIGIGVYFLFGTAWGLPNAFLLVFFLFYVFCCAVSICAVVFVLLSEMYPTRVRGIAMSIAGLSLWVGTYLIGQLTPWMLENLTPAGTFFLFAAMCIPYIVIMWRAVPETTGRSLEEIEKYWMN